MTSCDDILPILHLRPSLIAGFGAEALETTDLARLKYQACCCATAGIPAEHAKVAEPRGDGELVITAGVGWRDDIIGHATTGRDLRSPAGRTFQSGEPLVIPDLYAQTEYDIPDVLREHGVAALVNVPIRAAGRTYGVLVADVDEPRDFAQDEIDFLSALAHLLAAALRRADADAALRANEAWLRQALDVGRMGTWALDPRTYEVMWSDGVYTLLGYRPGEVMPSRRLFLSHVHRDDRPAVRAALDRGIRHGKVFSRSFRVVRRDDEVRWWDGRALVEYNDERAPVRMIGIVADITERREAEERLQKLQDELVPELLWRNDPSGTTTWVNRRWLEYTGQTLDDLQGGRWLNVIHPDDRERTRREFEAAITERRPMNWEHRIRAADGTYRWFMKRAEPAYDEHGSIVEWFGAETDIDDLKRLQEQQQVLVAELQHRTRNLLAVVRSLSHETARSTGTLEDFMRKFNSRLAALARVQGLLSRGEDCIDLNELVRTELAAHGADVCNDRVRVTGPAVPLDTKATQTLALALHELATNAVKHGALAQAAGRLMVSWSVEVNGKPRVELRWREEGVQLPADGEETRHGFGRQLIEKALPYDLGAETRFELAADGVRCRIKIPLDQRSC